MFRRDVQLELNPQTGHSVPSVFQAEAVDAGYGDSVVLHSLNLQLDAGLQLAVQGVSGSGKTTLLRLLAGLIRPLSGTARLLGINLAAASEPETLRLRRSSIGVVFQDGNLLDELTALGNVALPLRLQGLAKSQANARAAAVLASLGLGEFGRARPVMLSGGQRQRVAVARAVVHSPTLILADEPTASLDRRNADAALDTLLLACHSIQSTLVLATHDVAAAERCKAFIHLDDGRVVSSTLC